MKIEIYIENARNYQFENGELWFKGFLHNWEAFFTAIKNISLSNKKNTYDQLLLIIEKLDGQFSFVFRSNEITIAVCDRIRSHPLFYSSKNDKFYITDRAQNIKNILGSPRLNKKAITCIKMSGYAYGNNTIYEELYQLPAGNILKVNNSNARSDISRYYNYSPWKSNEYNLKYPKKDLSDLMLNMYEKLIKSINGRSICISLSAGLDSRAIVSGLHHLGYKKVKCFSYGLQNNYEATAGKKIAEKLNYPYYFIKKTPAIMRASFQSDQYKEFTHYTDTYASTPPLHQFYSVKKLKEAGFVSEEDIFINGYSGDFLTGGHITQEIKDANLFDTLKRKENILQHIITKHYSLWENQKDLENTKLIKEIAWEQLNHIFESETKEIIDYAICENFEWKNRQTLYSMNQPRIYEYWGHDWRLPLWDYDFMDFWEKVPLSLKFNQKLYRETLFENNWGDVWQNSHYPVYRSPSYLTPIRAILYIAMLPLGRKRWEDVNKRYFDYWTEILCYMGIVNYGKVIRDKRGYRHAISWLTELYLNDKGVL